MKAQHVKHHAVETLPDRPLPDRKELTLVAPVPAGERARQLHLEAKKASLIHLEALQTSLAEAHDLAQSVVDAGDLYAPGLAAFAARLSEELFWRGKSLEALSERQRAAAVY